MRTMLLFLALTSIAFSQANAIGHKPTREEIKEALGKQTKEQLIEAQLDAMFPPSLIGRNLPASILVKHGQDKAVVIFMQSKCIHCQKEVPFYRDLSSASKEVKIVPAFYAGDVDREVFLRDNKWSATPETFTQDDMQGFIIRGTPTTVLAVGGKVIASFQGELNSAEREQVNQFVKGGL